MANLAEIPEGAALLDVGTGSGSVLIPAAEKTGDYGLGIGVDINIGGLWLALPRIKERNLRNTALAQMDAESLGFMDGLFDCVLSGFVGWSDCFDFVKLDFAGPDNRLAEMSRMLRVGGRVGISSWARQEDLDWLGYQFQSYLPAYSAEQGIGSSWMAYSKENAPGFERLLQDGNFQDIEITAETEVFVSADEEEWWQQMWGAGWWAQIDSVAVADADKLKQFKEKVFENLQEHKHNDGIHFSKTVLFAFGRKKL